MQEIWKFYKEAGKSRYYKKGTKFYVSNFGNVRSDDEIIEIKSDKNGYKQFCKKLLHRIVYELFVGKIPDGLEIDHIDTNPSNNRLDNLRAVTRKENNNNPLTRKHSSEAKRGDKNPMWKKKITEETRKKLSQAHKGRFFSEETRSKISKSVSRQVQQINQNTGEIIKIWASLTEAEKQLGIKKSVISNCCHGKQKSAGGYFWRRL